MKKVKISGLTLALKRREEFLMYRCDGRNVAVGFELVRTNRQARLVVLAVKVTGARGDIKALGLSPASSIAGVYPDYALTILPGVRMAVCRDAKGDVISKNGTSIVIEADRDIWGIVRGSIADREFLRHGRRLMVPDGS